MRCEYCKQDFIPDKRNKRKAKYCSVKCRKYDWKEKNPEKYKETTKAYNDKRRADPILKQLDKESRQRYYQTMQGRYKTYKRGAKERMINFNLTKDEFMTFWENDCYYCGQKIEGVGIDRVDNSKGYKLDNCVPCCIICNKMKMVMTIEEFISHCKKIIQHNRRF